MEQIIYTGVINIFDPHSKKTASDNITTEDWNVMNPGHFIV